MRIAMQSRRRIHLLAILAFPTIFSDVYRTGAGREVSFAECRETSLPDHLGGREMRALVCMLALSLFLVGCPNEPAKAPAAPTPPKDAPAGPATPAPPADAPATK